jgi:hypothetical protein
MDVILRLLIHSATALEPEVGKAGAGHRMVIIGGNSEGEVSVYAYIVLRGTHLEFITPHSIRCFSASLNCLAELS